MSEPTRLRRPVPERTEPIREWSRLFEAPPPPPPTDGGDTSESWWSRSDSGGTPGVGEGVATGYRVIDDYLRQGQELARGFGTMAGASPLGPNFQALTERLLRDAFLWWSQLAGMLPGLGATGATPDPAEPGADREGQRTVVLDVEVDATGPAAVRVELAPTAQAVSLGVHPLCAPERDHPPLEDVRVEPGPGGPCLRVRVPDGQPPGVYAGVLFHRESGDPCGTVRVRIGPREA